MFTGSIKISELDALTAVLGEDFFPVVQSGSMTTFRVTVADLNDWFRVSGSALSASWASRSLDSLQSVSASWASASISSSATVTASYAFTGVTSSFSHTASHAFFSISASLSANAISASFAPFNQSFQASGSWASQSLSSSFATSASYAPAIGDTIPVGTVMAFGGGTAPQNWLECNGAAYLTSSFPELYQALSGSGISASYGYLSDSFGNRDASGIYFKIPDLRGEFVRGWDNGRGIDINRAFGSLQTASVGNHYHGVGEFADPSQPDHAYLILRSWSDGSTYTGRLLNGEGSSVTTRPVSSPTTGVGTTRAINSGDTHPRNTAMMWCIKYSNTINFATTGSATLAGDVNGTINNTTVVKLRNIPVAAAVPDDGDILLYDSASNQWLGGTPNIGGAPGKSYWVSNPTAVFPNGDDIYIYNYSVNSGRRNLVHVNQATNVATYLTQWPQNASNMYGRIFRQTIDSQLHIISFSNVDLYDYDIAGNVVTRITGSGAYSRDLPVKVDWSSGSLRPTVWTLYGSYLAGGEGDTPTVQFRKHWWTGASWTRAFGPTLDLADVVNGTEYRKFINYSTNPSDNQNTLLWDYNYIKKRYYLIDNSSGYLHIFSQDVGDIDTNFDTASISYVKTLAVPVSSMDNWQDADTEKMVVDYHPDTGEERGICQCRRGNTSLLGVAAYIYWPEV